MLESPFQTMFRHFWSEKNKMDTGVSFILLLSAAKRLTFCLILLKMTAYVLLLFSVFFLLLDRKTFLLSKMKVIYGRW